MTTAAWPVGVNQAVLADGYQEAQKDNVDRFTPDSGPSLTNLKSIMDTENFEFEQWLTIAEYATLKAWYRDTIQQGSLPFTRLHPTEETECTFVFAQDGFQLVGAMPDDYLVHFSLERIA